MNQFSFELELGLRLGIGLGSALSSGIAPDQFGAGDWSVADLGTNGDVRITITTLPDDGGSALTDLEYQVDGGSWLSLGDTATGNYDLTSFTDGVAADVSIRAVNANGNGTASATKSVTSTGVPDAFALSDWTVADAAGDNGALVTIAALPATHGSAITQIDYRIDAGSWTDSGVTTATTFSILGLTNDVEVTVELRATNANGSSGDSDDKTVTPIAGGATPDTFDTAGGGVIAESGSAVGTIDVTIVTIPNLNGGTLAEIHCQYKLSSAGSYTETDPLNLAQTGSFTLLGLTAGEDYDLQFATETEYGQSAWSTAIANVTAPSAVVAIDAATLAEASAQGTEIGNLSVVGGTGTYSFALSDTVSSQFQLDAGDDTILEAGSSPTDYETATYLRPEVTATGGTPSPVTTKLTVNVTNVLEVTLGITGLDNATISAGAAEDDLLGTLQGTTVGSSVFLIDDSDDQFYLVDEGSNVWNVYVGPTALDVDTSILVRETHPDASNSPDDTNIDITVTPIPPTIAELTKIGNFALANSGSTHAVIGASIGAAYADRRVIVPIGGFDNQGRTLVSATIGGVAATVHLDHRNGNYVARLISAVVPTGDTADIILTESGSVFSSLRAGVYTCDDSLLVAADPITTYADGTTQPLSAPAFTPDADAFMIAAMMFAATGSNANVVFSDDQSDVFTTEGTSLTNLNTGYSNGVAGGSTTVSAAYSGSDTTLILFALAWR